MRTKLMAAGLAAVLFMPVLASAQDALGVVQAIGAMTTARDRSPSFGGALGGRVGWMEITGEFGKMQDIAPRDLDRIIQQFQSDAGITGPFASVRVPAYYGLVNLKLVPSSGMIRPFVTGGAGLARLHPQIRQGVTEVSLPGVFTAEKATKPLITIGGGLRFGLGPNIHLDTGYRFSRVYSDYKVDTDLRNDRLMTNLGTFYGALGLRF